MITTPGPWKADNYTIKAVVSYETSPDKFRHKEVTLAQTIPVDFRDRDEHRGNAKLMAKAPELLAMVQALLNCCELNLDEIEHETIDMIAHAQALIDPFL